MTPAFEQQCRPPTQLTRTTAAAIVSLTERMLSGQGTETNKAASDAAIEAHVVMSFACVEWRGVALSPTGHLFRTFQATSIK